MVSVRATCAILMAGPILAACAAAPKDAATGGQQPAGSVPVAAAADPVGTDAGAAPAASETAASPSSTTGAEQSVAAQLKPLPEFGVVDLNRQPPAENTGQVCRVMLRPNTNSLVNVCGTPAQWKKYEAAEANAAQDFVLRMRSLAEPPPSRPVR